MEAIASSSKTTTKKKHIFNAQAYLASCGVARKLVEYRKSEKVYSQGDPATNVMYIQEGRITLSVINEVGKEAVVAILGPGDFFGEGAWQVSQFAWGRRLRSLPRLYLLLNKKR